LDSILSLEQWSWAASIVGALIALVGFPLLSWQLFITNSQRRDAIRLSRSQVLFAADAVLATHAEVAANLRGGWDGNINPTEEELPLVEPYLGVFERIFVAYREGQIDSEILDQLYGYRISNIWSNRQIVKIKLQNDERKVSWKRIIALTYVIEAHRGERFPLHTDKYFPAELFDRRTARDIQRKLLRR
jgi:hypothetical protein